MTDGTNHLEQGLAAFKAGDFQGAIDELEVATREEQDNYRAFNYLGAAYAGKGKYNAAIGAFKSAEQINPNVASIHYNLGQAYEAAGVPAEAQYEYEFALRLDAGYTRAEGALAALKTRYHHHTEQPEPGSV
ncbi:MAG: tetratricopeptide repeat protein [Armatimonadota bacterium]|nr:tetratricopeptide repeat protein [Armatimonadota bacterium]